MVRVGLDVPLATITRGNNHRDLVHDLIEWADSQGRLDELVQKAHEHNSGNELLSAFVTTRSREAPLLSVAPLASSGVPPRAARRGVRWLALGAVGLAVVVFAVHLALSRHTRSGSQSAPRVQEVPAPPVLDPAQSAQPGARLVTSDPALVAFFARWSDAVLVHHGATSLAPYYTERAQFRGSGGLTNTSAIEVYFSNIARQGGTFDIDWSHSEWVSEPLTSPDASLACTHLPHAEGDILKVRAWAREYAPQRMGTSSGQVPCSWLVGRYLLRLRRVSGELRICHETWALREGVCASCPTAPACPPR